MEKDNLLMTEVTIQGRFYDMALYSGKLYLWGNDQTLHIYRWNKWMESVVFSDLPIYQYALSTQFLSLNISNLAPFLVKEVVISPHMRDFVIFNHTLYLITDDGFYSLDTDQAEPHLNKIQSGSFHLLSLSEKNRMILVSNETGVYEYRSEQQKMIHWDDTPTASIVWDNHHILQLDDAKQPLQLLRFHVSKKETILLNKVSKDQLYTQQLYSNTSLLKPHRKEETSNLFGYLSSEETASLDSLLEVVAVKEVPLPYLSAPLLDENSLYIEESDGLYLLLDDKPYLIAQQEYQKYRTFYKSRNYKHYLHYLTRDTLTILIFHKRT